MNHMLNSRESQEGGSPAATSIPFLRDPVKQHDARLPESRIREAAESLLTYATTRPARPIWPEPDFDDPETRRVYANMHLKVHPEIPYAPSAVKQ